MTVSIFIHAIYMQCKLHKLDRIALSCIFFWNDKIFIVELSLFYDHTQLYLSAIMDKKHSNERI